MVIKEFDIFPDDINWKDTGCEIFSSCLNCPLDKCLEEQPRGKQKQRMLARSRQMNNLKNQGKSVNEIARIFQVSIRTVQRSLALTKKKEKEKQDGR